MSDELTSNLRELAAAGETRPTLTGAEIRGRAVRRRRRRRTVVATASVSAAAALALLVAVDLRGGTDQRPAPAASPTGTPSFPATPDATVDLSRRQIDVAGRVLPVTSGTELRPTATGRMTVTAKSAAKVMPGTTVGLKSGYDLKVSWVIELSSSSGSANYIAAIAYDEKAPGNYDRTTGWIGLRSADAAWLYKQVKLGAVIDIEGSAPRSTPGRSTAGQGANGGTGTGTDVGAGG
ncbi:L,D-transpeptidase [Streptomyces sp. 142MFCol3.1]|uniref:L,D-transpeptidase n=1 Tax=Streptomyces sp. 142MFCol3.1 TaxID=1172179 RepID=UPI0003F595DD|nr:L,D-transpeptidase [Streptomyces sp. 142MFCol3.1]